MKGVVARPQAALTAMTGRWQNEVGPIRIGTGPAIETCGGLRSFHGPEAGAYDAPGRRRRWSSTGIW